MSPMSHPDREDLIVYALGGLDPGEEAAVAVHLEGCEACARELAGYEPAVSALAEGVEPVEPPPELRERVLAIVNEEAVGRTARSSEGLRASRFRISLDRFLVGFATGLAALAVGIAAAVGLLAAGDDGESARTVEIANTAGDAGGQLVIDDGKSTLQMTGMPQLKQGAVYQVWVADPSGEVTPSATFLPHGDGTATAALPEAGDDLSQVMVTAEPGPNRTVPSSHPLLEVSLG